MLAITRIGILFVIVTLLVGELVLVVIQAKEVIELGLMPPQIVKEFLFFIFCHTYMIMEKIGFVKVILPFF